MISLIAAVGKNRELGRNGELVFHLPEDMRYFKNTTMGHKVLMGRRTWESLPKKLPGRYNIVVSRHIARAADEVVRDLKGYLEDNKASDEEIFVIGGGMVYSGALPYATRIYLTEVEAEVPDADTFFPDFDHSKYTKEIIKRGKSDELEYSFVVYHKK